MPKPGQLALGVASGIPLPQFCHAPPIDLLSDICPDRRHSDGFEQRKIFGRRPGQQSCDLFDRPVIQHSVEAFIGGSVKIFPRRKDGYGKKTHIRRGILYPACLPASKTAPGMNEYL